MTRTHTRNGDTLLQSTLQAFQDCSDLSERRFPESDIVIVYFDHLVGKEPLRKGVLELVPNATLHSFARDYYDDGIDPVVPIVKADKESIEVSASARSSAIA